MAELNRLSASRSVQPALSQGARGDLFAVPKSVLSEGDVLTVSALSRQLKSQIEKQFAFVRVRGEISSLKRHSSGHTYFSLKDPGQEAVLNAICWRGTRTAVALEEGLEIIATGHLTTYPARSNYQIIVTEAEAAGQGALLKLLQERKQRLEAEGLFTKRRPLPKFPRIIGVVTSPTGAVIQDILHRVSDRFPCRVLLWPVAVQGTGAAEQVARAIRGFNAMTEARPDVLIVARGGGSLEDLWAFNEETVVRAAFESALPLISAVGHETDTTLIDYAADCRAPTPTAAAEMATPVATQLWEALASFRQRLVQGLRRGIETATWRVRNDRLPDVGAFVNERAQKLDERFERLVRVITLDQLRKTQELKALVGRILPPREKLRMAEAQITAAWREMALRIRIKQDTQRRHLEELATRLDQSSYEGILRRGFCLVSGAQGLPIQSAEAARSTFLPRLRLNFYDGEINVIRDERPPHTSE